MDSNWDEGRIEEPGNWGSEGLPGGLATPGVCTEQGESLVVGGKMFPRNLKRGSEPTWSCSACQPSGAAG